MHELKNNSSIDFVVVRYVSFGSFVQATLQSTYLVAHEPDDDNILRTRTYDVSIT